MKIEANQILRCGGKHNARISEMSAFPYTVPDCIDHGMLNSKRIQRQSRVSLQKACTHYPNKALVSLIRLKFLSGE